MNYARFCAAAAVLSLLAPAAFAGVSGQPAVGTDAIPKFRAAVAQYQIPGGDISKARPDLSILVDTDPTQDFTDLIVPALSDDQTYRTLSATVSDALTDLAPADPKRVYLYYNLARLHLLRARYFDLPRQKQTFLKSAQASADKIPARFRDASIVALRGDIAAEGGDVSTAVSYYNRIGANGGDATQGKFLAGEAYLRARRYADAKAALDDALTRIGTDADSAQLRQTIYQDIADLYVQQNQPRPALTALAESVRGKTPLVYVRTDTARKLLAQGYAKEIADFAQDALRRSPGDDALESLLLDAQKKAKP